MNSPDITKAHNHAKGIASLAAAPCTRKGLVRRVVAASAVACSLMAGLNVTSAQAQDARQTGAMGGSMADTMSGAGYMPPGVMVGKVGEWMLGYQVMFENAAGNLAGTNRISNE